MNAHTLNTSWGIEETDEMFWVGPMRQDGKKVADIVVGLPRSCNYREEYNTSQRERARLIAAAPDMLDALRPLPIEWLDSGVLKNNESDVLRIEMRIVGTSYEAEMHVSDLRAIRAAIAKATGETAL